MTKTGRRVSRRTFLRAARPAVEAPTPRGEGRAASPTPLPPPCPSPQGGREKRPLVSREAFARISEVEGVRLSDEARKMFAEFDRQGLSAEERRQRIVARFKREAAE
jgi:hypothetical protein